MRSLRMFVVMVVVASMLAACGQKPEKTDKQAGEQDPNAVSAAVGFVGYVVKQKGDRILVVNATERDFSASDGASHYYEAIWFSKAPSDIVIGDRVDVVSDGGIEASYPGQGAASSVEVLTTTEPTGAKRKEAEAVRIALQDSRVSGYEVPVVKSVEYDTEAKAWFVEVTQNGDENSLKVKVPATDDGQELGDKPPLPVVYAGEQAITVYQSSYCWTAKKTEQSTQSVCADYASPFGMLKDVSLDQVAAGQEIVFRFDSKQPTETSVSRFEESSVTQVELDGKKGFLAPSEPGKYYYGIDAKWLRDTDRSVSEGSSSYAFAIEVK
ncbi:DUF3221 domain-containing protein [Cohnella endophytica]|uniref:DUF3221 domain-containing protein n=1 Tax=Cohnella endophytica TaxID=2419778 RepID=A0A494XWI5_9BACL|nr:DUF3221 domain-containing protein [Cohnella endophytica]RKP54967.1 DUF3221 domain-containing protein [Cohnella endophytica]